jgi:hypothetical protein
MGLQFLLHFYLYASRRVVHTFSSPRGDTGYGAYVEMPDLGVHYEQDITPEL